MSMINLEQLFAISEAAVFNICNHLHARDLFSLEMTNRTICTAIDTAFWRWTKQLTLYSLEAPLNPLSIERTKSVQIIENKKIEQLLTRCTSLIRLDLNAWRCCELPLHLRRKEMEFVEKEPTMYKDEHFEWADDGQEDNDNIVVMLENNWTLQYNWGRIWPIHLGGQFRIGQEQLDDNADTDGQKKPTKYFYTNDPVRIQSVLDAIVLIKNITNFCKFLRFLDLSYIPFSGQLLITLSKGLGHSLEIIRLTGCFKMPLKSGRIMPPNICPDYNFAFIYTKEFAEFLSNMPKLIELNFANNDLEMLRNNDDNQNNDSLVTIVLNKLKFLELFGTKVSAYHLIEFLEKSPNLSTLHCNIHADTFDNLETNNLFFQKAANLQHFWLGIYGSYFEYINFSESKTLSSLRIWFHSGLEDIEIQFVGKHSMISKEFDEEGPLPNLNELYLSFGGKTTVSHILRDTVICNPFTKMSNLVRLYISYQKSTEFNGSLLNAVAQKCPHLQELRLIFCKHITWKAFAAFLDYCPKIKLFEGAEQMTDLLLEQIVMKCNNQIQQNFGTSVIQPSKLFYFIRVNAEQFLPLESAKTVVLKYSDIWSGELQSETQNLYPGIVYSENDGKVGGREDLAHDMQRFAWPSTNLIINHRYD